MTYTCYEMIRDCRAGRPEGWRYFVSNYVPVMRRITAHYGASAEMDGAVEQVLSKIHDAASPLFESLEPAPERWFVAHLRQAVVNDLTAAEPEIPVSLETVAESFEPLTLTQKLAVWMETMRYDAAATGAMLRMAPATVEKTRAQAQERLRGKMDHWRQTVLPENGRALGQAAASTKTKDCLGPKVFLDVLNGRATWQGREEMERHVNACWCCIDHFARMAETIELLHGIKPLTDAEAEPWLNALGIEKARPAFWQRLVNRA